MKAGIIGVGAIAHYHRLAIAGIQELTLHAACDTDGDRLDEFCNQYGCRSFADYRDLLGEVDVAVIATPHALHYPVGLAALDQECHIVMEKPFAVAMREGLHLLEKAKETNLKIVTAESMYHVPEVRIAREMASSGKLGEFISGSIINYKDYFTSSRPAWFLQPELAGGGQLINVGVHRIAHARSIIGGEEVSVKASVGFFQPGCEVEGNGLLFVGYKDGSSLMLEENGYYRLHPQLDRACHFNFEHGVITFGDKLSVIHKDGSVEYPDVPPNADNPYQVHYQELVAAIRDDRAPYPGALESLKDARIILAAYESARTGREVWLDEPGGEFMIEMS